MQCRTPVLIPVAFVYLSLFIISHYVFASLYLFLSVLHVSSSRYRFNPFLPFTGHIWPEWLWHPIIKFCLKLTYAEFLHNLSYISCDNNPFLSKSLVKYCLRYKAVKAVTFFKVSQGLYWVLCLSSTGHIWPLQVKRGAHWRSLLHFPAKIPWHSPPSPPFRSV